jgi:multidrug efflux pump subunit AcrA (membrane-fusion protein)
LKRQNHERRRIRGAAAGPSRCRATPPAPTPIARPGKGSRIGAIVVLLLIVASLAWYFASDRLTPYTSQARVQAFVVPVAAEVPGKVLKVHVKNNDEVQSGTASVRDRPEPVPHRAAAQPFGL